jgi:S-formylglutathione hydrolase FrmB
VLKLRSLVAVSILAAALIAAPAARATDLPAGCAAATGQPSNVIDCTVPGENLGTVDTHVRLVLPDGYGSAPVPVVYLLHGVGDTYKTWVANTDVETFAPGQGALVVMPDGGRTPEAGWYSDWKDGSRRYETFHIEVLIPWIESHFVVLTGQQHRAVMGLSMGGFGALSYAGRHPHTFAAAASFSGLLDTQQAGPVTGVGFAAGHSQLGTPDSRTWGDPVADQVEWSAHNPTALARTGVFGGLGGNLWLAYGSGTPGGPAGDSPDKAANYGVEHYIWHTNQSFKLALTQAGTSFHDVSYLGGLHDWPYWQLALHQVLPQVAAVIS